MITIKLIIWLLVITAFVYADWYQIVKKGDRPFYLVENILKGVFLICWCSLIWNTQYERFTVVLILWAITAWWILFDIAMGLILHTDPLYVGRNSGWLDRLHYLNTGTMIAYWTLKFIALFTLIGTTINIYRHG
jgi:hypothetical protein